MNDESLPNHSVQVDSHRTRFPPFHPGRSKKVVGICRDDRVKRRTGDLPARTFWIIDGRRAFSRNTARPKLQAQAPRLQRRHLVDFGAPGERTHTRQMDPVCLSRRAWKRRGRQIQAREPRASTYTIIFLHSISLLAEQQYTTDMTGGPADSSW